MTEEEKEVLKKAFKENFQANFGPEMSKWLDEQKKETYQNVGKWIIHAITIAIISAGMYLMYWMENHKQ